MRSTIASLIAMFCLSCPANSKGLVAQEDKIIIEILCNTETTCTYTGDDIPIKVRIINQGESTIGLPMSFLRRSGPIMEIIDNKTGQQNNLKRNLSDLSLMAESHEILPGQHADIDWIVFKDEIEQFQHEDIEITVRAEVNSPAFRNGTKTEINLSGSTVIRGTSSIYVSEQGKR